MARSTPGSPSAESSAPHRPTSSASAHVTSSAPGPCQLKDPAPTHEREATPRCHVASRSPRAAVSSTKTHPLIRRKAGGVGGPGEQPAVHAAGVATGGGLRWSGWSKLGLEVCWRWGLAVGLAAVSELGLWPTETQQGGPPVRPACPPRLPGRPGPPGDSLKLLTCRCNPVCTGTVCAAACFELGQNNSKPYNMAGLEYHNNCFCGVSDTGDDPPRLPPLPSSPSPAAVQTGVPWPRGEIDVPATVLLNPCSSRRTKSGPIAALEPRPPPAAPQRNVQRWLKWSVRGHPCFRLVFVLFSACFRLGGSAVGRPRHADRSRQLHFGMQGRRQPDVRRVRPVPESTLRHRSRHRLHDWKKKKKNGRGKRKGSHHSRLSGRGNLLFGWGVYRVSPRASPILTRCPRAAPPVLAGAQRGAAC